MVGEREAEAWTALRICRAAVARQPGVLGPANKGPCQAKQTPVISWISYLRSVVPPTAHPPWSPRLRLPIAPRCCCPGVPPLVGLFVCQRFFRAITDFAAPKSMRLSAMPWPSALGASTSRCTEKAVSQRSMTAFQHAFCRRVLGRLKSPRQEEEGCREPDSKRSLQYPSYPLTLPVRALHIGTRGAPRNFSRADV